MSSRVHKGWYLFFGVSALLLIVAAGLLQRTPGYMDADYYYAGAIQLGDGKGFTQPFIWNYLDNPQSLPAPLFTYWMPLVSLLAAPGWAIFKSFTAARSLLWIVAALIPPLTIWIGMRLHGNSRLALLGGCFALSPAYYFVYLPTTDAFGLMMVLGSLFLITSGEQDQPSPWLVLGSGILSGLLHLSRADGILWFGAGGLWLMVTAWRRREQQARWLVMLALQLVLFTLGYLAVMAPWYVRNLQIFGWFFPPTGSRSLWLTRYEDRFVYPGSMLNLDHFLTGGIGLWGKAVWAALLANLQ
ncbi:MAG: hypothetical protein HY835_10595, partial [Anaerolineae bacterium]|nr:hypothetical protein [Anaerolineae bacterium]